MTNRATVFALQGELPPFTAEESQAILSAAQRYRDAYAGYVYAQKYDATCVALLGHEVQIASYASDDLTCFESWLLRAAVGHALPPSEYWIDSDDDFGNMTQLADFLGGRRPDPHADCAFDEDEES